MKSRYLFLLLSIVLVVTVIARAQDDDDDDHVRPERPRVMQPTEQPAGGTFACPYEQNFQRPHRIGAYTLHLLPTVKDAKDKKEKNDKKDDKDKDADDDVYQDGDARCRAVLTSRFGRHITIAYEWALSLDPISGTDLNGDGKPELVLSGYSGGLHCCFVYEIVSLGSTPRVLHTFQNLTPIRFEKQPDGTVLIRAADGVFDYFLLPHADAVIPQLVLKPQGNNLVDVSAQYPDLYDREIAQARQQISTEEIEKFRKSNFHARLYTDEIPTVRKVLTIVLDYVYSGREEMAWQTLDEMWPPADVSRVKSLINERRHRGMLANLACDCHPAMIAHRAAHIKRKPAPPDEISDPRIKSIIDD
jgi:hypothetical protein